MGFYSREDKDNNLTGSNQCFHAVNVHIKYFQDTFSAETTCGFLGSTCVWMEQLIKMIKAINGSLLYIH